MAAIHRRFSARVGATRPAGALDDPTTAIHDMPGGQLLAEKPFGQALCPGAARRVGDSTAVEMTA